MEILGRHRFGASLVGVLVAAAHPGSGFGNVDDANDVLNLLEEGRAWTSAFSLDLYFDLYSDAVRATRTEISTFRRNGDFFEWRFQIVPLLPDELLGPSTPWWVVVTDEFSLQVDIDGEPPIVGMNVLTDDADAWRRLLLNAPTSGTPVIGFAYGGLDIDAILRACDALQISVSDGLRVLSGTSAYGIIEARLDPARAYQPVFWRLDRGPNDLVGEKPLRELGMTSWSSEIATTEFHLVNGYFIPARLSLTESRTFDDSTGRTDEYKYAVEAVDLDSAAVAAETFGRAIPNGSLFPLRDFAGKPSGVVYEWSNGRPRKSVPEEAAAHAHQAVRNYRELGVVTPIDPSVAIDGPYCSVVCLAALAQWFGRTFDVDGAVSRELLRTPEGATLADLHTKVRDDWGVDGTGFTELTPLDCSLMPVPAILALRASVESTESDHFAVLLANVGGKSVTLYDPSKGLVTLSLAQLDARFEGVALALAEEKQIGWFRVTTFLLRAVVAVVVLVLVVALRRIATHPKVRTQTRGVLVECAIVMALSGLAAAVGAVVSPIGLDANATRFVQSRYAPAFVELISPSEIAARPEGTFVPIDARGALAFGTSHIPGAVHVPAFGATHPDSPIIPLPETAPTLVVYCENVNCSFDETVIRRLSSMGYQRLAIIEGGWAAWTEESE